MIEGPVLAVILLFPIGDAKGEDTRLGRLRLFNIGVVLQVANQIYAWVTPLAGTPPTNALEGPYYMKQTIQNACGTIAVLHAVLNNCDFIASGEEAARVAGMACYENLSPDDPFLICQSPTPFWTSFTPQQRTWIRNHVAHSSRTRRLMISTLKPATRCI